MAKKVTGILQGGMGGEDLAKVVEKIYDNYEKLCVSLKELENVAEVCLRVLKGKGVDCEKQTMYIDRYIKDLEHIRSRFVFLGKKVDGWVTAIDEMEKEAVHSKVDRDVLASFTFDLRQRFKGLTSRIDAHRLECESVLYLLKKDRSTGQIEVNDS